MVRQSSPPMQEHGLNPEAYKELPLWKNSYAIGQAVDRLTNDFPHHNAMVGILREKSAALPVAVTLCTLADNPAQYADSLKDVYELAHDAEYVLFFCLMFKYLPLEDVGRLQAELCEVKQLVIEAVQETINR